MNLKESFRYQNYLTRLFNEVQSCLGNRNNMVHVQQVHMRHNANPDAQDETIDASKERPYTQDNGTVIAFMECLITEKYELARAIGKAKASCAIDIDAETAHNTMRRNMATTLERIGNIKPSECKAQGYDFKFNATGEQVRYCYDIKETTTIDFDRNHVKHLVKSLNGDADETSNALDRCMIDVQVSFTPMFNTSDSFDDALEAFAAQRKMDRRAV